MSTPSFSLNPKLYFFNSHLQGSTVHVVVDPTDFILEYNSRFRGQHAIFTLYLFQTG